MQPDPYLPVDATLIPCTWCGAEIHTDANAAHDAGVFCSQHCEIEANFWLYHQLRLIDITQCLRSPEDLFDGLQDECNMPDDPCEF